MKKYKLDENTVWEFYSIYLGLCLYPVDNFKAEVDSEIIMALGGLSDSALVDDLALWTRQASASIREIIASNESKTRDQIIKCCSKLNSQSKSKIETFLKRLIKQLGIENTVEDIKYRNSVLSLLN